MRRDHRAMMGNDFVRGCRGRCGSLFGNYITCGDDWGVIASARATRTR